MPFSRLTRIVRISGVLAILLAAHTQSAKAQSNAPTTRRIAVAPAETLAIHQRGNSGDVVVIVPGMLGSHVSFRHVMADLEQKGVQVYVVDLLGFGSSTRPKEADYSFSAQVKRLHAVLESIGASDVVLVCHALAGGVCYRAAHSCDRIRALVSINGAPAETPKTPNVATAVKLAPVLKFFGAEGIVRKKVRSGLIKSSKDPSWVTDKVIADYLAPFNGDVFSVLGVLRRMEQAHEPVPLAPVLPKLTVPVEVLVGRDGDGDAMRPDELQKLQTIQGVTITRVMDAGQYVQEEKPGVVTAAILRALEAQPAVQPGNQH